MKRERILIVILIVVALAAVPYSYADRAATKARHELASLDAEVQLLRDKAEKVRDLEARIAAEAEAIAAVDARLIGTDPFATIQQALTDVATRAGVQVMEISLVGAEPVKDLPALVQYGASVEVAGTAPAFVDFVRLLERHALLIEVPDLKVAVPANRQIRTRLSLKFFGKAPGGSW